MKDKFLDQNVTRIPNLRLDSREEKKTISTYNKIYIARNKKISLVSDRRSIIKIEIKDSAIPIHINVLASK